MPINMITKQISRNRLGVNDEAHENAKAEAAKLKQKAAAKNNGK